MAKEPSDPPRRPSVPSIPPVGVSGEGILATCEYVYVCAVVIVRVGGWGEDPFEAQR